jgi:hypothetical protein
VSRWTIDGELTMVVDPLKLPPSARSATDIEDSSAGQLFVTRARWPTGASPSPARTRSGLPTSAGESTEIPLGLELAAVRTRWLSLAGIADAAYLPREVFFGRLGLAGVFFSLWATDFGRFFPATGGLLPIIG